MTAILVTGGAGYIGSHTCKLLASSGYRPICYDNLSTGYADFVKWGPLEVGDLHDTAKLMSVMKAYQPVAVIHFAARAYVGESVENPFKYYKNNVGGTLSLLEAMRATGVKPIVFSSTCATYGIPDDKTIREDCPQNPINPYGRTKLVIEMMLRDLSSRGEINQISLRYFNAAGADKDGEIGEKHDPETHLIPLAIRAGMGGRPLSIFGTDFPTPDGTCVRDYIHVEDLASAHLAAVQHLLAGGDSDFFNLGTGRGNSVREIVDALRGLGIPVVANEIGRREGDPAYLVADAAKAKVILKWQPRYMDIKDTLATAIAWHKKIG